MKGTVCLLLVCLCPFAVGCGSSGGRVEAGETTPAATVVASDTAPETPVPDPIEGCEECLATGGWWVHLRMCQSCGHIGCCDNSKNKHATKHFHASSHPVIRSYEPGEEWGYCYPDELFMEVLPARPGEDWRWCYIDNTFV